MSDPSPAAQVQGALIEDLTVAGRQQVGSQDHKGVGPHQKCVLHTPPLIIVQVTLGTEKDGEREGRGREGEREGRRGGREGRTGGKEG